MHRIILALLLFSLSFNLTFGQKTIVGKILSKTTHEPIPYANIGIVNSNVGTISNFDGTFSIFIPQKLSKDTLTFSSLGFYKDVLAVNPLEAKKDYTVYLSEKATILKSVVITAKRKKEKLVNLGNFTSYGGNYEPDTTYAGRAVALLIDNKSFPKGSSFPVYVKKATLCIFRNNFNSFKFRIRLNKYDSLTGKPGEDLIDKSIIVESNLTSGWLDFDLSTLNYKATGPFFVTFEQLIDKDGRAAIAYGFSDIIHSHPEYLQIDTVRFEGRKEVTQKLIKGGADLPGTFIGITNSNSALAKYSCFVRQSSLGAWTKVPMVIAAMVSVTGQASSVAEEPTIPEILVLH
jgi:hypothetical protein